MKHTKGNSQHCRINNGCFINAFLKSLIALADNSSTCMQVDMKDTGSRFVGSQFIFRFDFQLKIFSDSYFMLTSLSAYLHVSRLLMVTRLCIWRMDFHDTEIRTYWKKSTN